MTRISKFPTVIDDLLHINVKSLLNSTTQNESITLSWSKKGHNIASMRCRLIKHGDELTACFSYQANESNRHLQVEITSTPSNLGIGMIPFFICPSTHTRCRKLYLYQGTLVSKAAIDGALYDTQVWSKGYRALNNTFGEDIQLEKLYEQLYSPYFKSLYRNQPTQRLLNITNKIAILEQRPQEDVLREILSQNIN